MTDYCVTRSYELAKAAKEQGRLKDCALLFPNIELRLNTGTVKGNFVNIHLLVSPEHPKHVFELNRFLGRLVFSGFSDKFACTPEDLRRLGRLAGGATLDDEAALRRGAGQFKVSLDNLLESYRDIAWAQDNILSAVSANADGTSGVKEAADATLREEIEKAGHLMFASSAKQRDFWLGRGKASPAELLDRYGGLKPCIWGCDAHELARVGKPDEDRFCWIKGVPAFDTLRQAVIDPERAYVGAGPLTPAAASQIIDRVVIENAPWARTPVIHLNPGLVAVIGARGSGKTALVDMIAAGCDSYQHSERPSFLARAAEHLGDAAVTLTWKTGEPATCRLDAPVNDWPEAYPRARYLSQQFVEELCSIEGMPTLRRSTPSGTNDTRTGTPATCQGYFGWEGYTGSRCAGEHFQKTRRRVNAKRVYGGASVRMCKGAVCSRWYPISLVMRPMQRCRVVSWDPARAPISRFRSRSPFDAAPHWRRD